MHDELIAVAARRARRLTVLTAVVTALGPGVVVGVFVGPVAGVIAFVVIAGGIGGWLLAGAPGLRVRAWPTAAVRPADPQVANLNEGIALSHGRPPARALQVADDAPNVAAMMGNDGRTLLVTDGAVALLSRDQLEALCATQLSIADEDTCRRLEGVVTAVRVVRAASVAEPVVSSVFIAVNVWVGVAMLGVVTPGIAAAWFLGARLRWWARVAADATCVQTTRHPEPLVESLRVLARWRGPQVRTGLLTRLTGAGGGSWAVELGPRWSSRTAINGRAIDVRTSEMVDDTRLLVRAGLVRRVLLQGAPATVGSYEEVQDHVRRAGRAAARGGAVAVEGEMIGLDGVVDATQPAPAPPAWPPPTVAEWQRSPSQPPTTPTS